MFQSLLSNLCDIFLSKILEMQLSSSLVPFSICPLLQKKQNPFEAIFVLIILHKY